MYVKTIEVPDTMVNVTTDENYKYYWIRNLGERVVGVFKNSSGTGAEGFYATVGPRECVKVIPEETTLYFASANEDTTNKIEIYGTNTTECPFKGGKTEGRGGDNTHYKGTTTTALENGSTTNPIVIDGESYTAVFGDVVVYGYTEFVFDGTTWSEFGRPFDTTPTQGSTNAVTSDGVYKVTPFKRANGGNSAILGYGSIAIGGGVENGIVAANASQIASRNCAAIGGSSLLANTPNLTVIGVANIPRTGDLFNIGNGTDYLHRSNIVEVTATSANVNGDIKINNIAIPTPYTTMPTITADMLGQIAMYVGATGNGYTQGCFYIAATDGAAEPTYSWVQIGGGRTETVLWENTGTTNPQTIALSEAYTNFDEIVVYDGGNGKGISSNIYVQSVLSQNAVIGIIEDEERRIWYQITSPTTLNKVDEDTGLRLPLQSIIGIKH